MWGPHTVDRFADWNNCQLSRFNSRCWNPGSEAVHTFTTNWSGENYWWCPPVSLVPRVIAHAQACMAEGTLIVPEWKSAPFWPLLQPVEGQFAQFAVCVKELPLSESLFVPGLSRGSLLCGICQTEMCLLSVAASPDRSHVPLWQQRVKIWLCCVPSCVTASRAVVGVEAVCSASSGNCR